VVDYFGQALRILTEFQRQTGTASCENMSFYGKTRVLHALRLYQEKFRAMRTRETISFELHLILQVCE
jgi:hypothetical protein